MSIRQFSNQPCPDCQKDTTHLAMKCIECGHINLTASQAKAEFYRKQRAIAALRPGGLKLLAHRREQAVVINTIGKRKENRDRPTSAVTNRESVFGRGRGTKI